MMKDYTYHSPSRWLAVLVGFLLLPSPLASTGRGEEKVDMGTLSGDVQNWAMLIQNYILQVKLNCVKNTVF